MKLPRRFVENEDFSIGKQNSRKWFNQEKTKNMYEHNTHPIKFEAA